MIDDTRAFLSLIGILWWSAVSNNLLAGSMTLGIPMDLMEYSNDMVIFPWRIWTIPNNKGLWKNCTFHNADSLGEVVRLFCCKQVISIAKAERQGKSKGMPDGFPRATCIPRAFTWHVVCRLAEKRHHKQVSEAKVPWMFDMCAG